MISLALSFPREVGKALKQSVGAAGRKGRLEELPTDQVFRDAVCECACTCVCADVHAGLHLELGPEAGRGPAGVDVLAWIHPALETAQVPPV